jgi:hypothetical protein
MYTLLLVASTSLACGGPAVVRAPAGSPCESADACAPGLSCKGAVCAPPRSSVGGVCVRDPGCQPGLSCVEGRCSLGLAPPGQCAAACDHLRGLWIAEAGGLPPGAEPDQGLDASLADFDARCRARCGGRATVERVGCLLSARDLADVARCP